MFSSFRLQRWLLVFGIIIGTIVCAPSPRNYDEQRQQQDVNSPGDARKAFLLLCLTDGTIVSLEAWTGIHQSVVRSEPLLQTHYNKYGNQLSDANSVMILPGLDGRLYFKPPSPTFEDTSNTISEAPPLQELPLSMADLLENPVRSCQPVTTGASISESTDVSCGILTAQADVSLLALSAQTGTIKWQSGSGLRRPSHTQDESGPVLLLQRKDHWIQFVRTDDGQQLWNVSLGAYQALDFDLPLRQSDSRRHAKEGDIYDGENAKKQYRMMIDDDDDETNNIGESQPSLSADSQEDDLLPAIIFQDSGQAIVAVNPIDGSVLWRQDVPSTLASVFGIANGQWQTIPITMSPSFHEDTEPKRMIRTDESDLSIAQQMEHRRAVDLIEYERFLWEQRWSMLSSNPSSKPYTQLPKELPGRVDVDRHTFDTDLCWIEDESQWGTCPVKEGMLGVDVLQLPSPPPKSVVVLADGLLLSWSIVMVSVIGFLLFFLVIICFWYLRKKSQWIEMLTVASQRTQTIDEVGDTAEMPSEEKGIIGPAILKSPHSLHFSDRAKSNDLSNMDGVPVVRYSRYASEFLELHSLGKGGFGSVFQCQNTLDGRQYAIKKVSILSNSNDFQQQLHRVLREVKILAILDHPNIVRYYTAWLEIEEHENLHDGIESISDLLGEKTVGTLSRRLSFSSSILLQGTDDFLHLDNKNNPLGWSNGIDVSESSSLVLPRRRSLRATNGLDEDFMIFEGSQEGETPSLSGTNCQHNRDFHAPPTLCSDFVGSGLDYSERSESVAPNTGQIPAKGSGNDANAFALVVRRTLYIQMQLCSQKTLAEFLNDRKARCESAGGFKVDIPKALRIFLQIAEATAYVHACGLIHRDLKPNNCFMDETCSMVKVGDFGLSRESSGDDEESGSNYDGAFDNDTHEGHTAGVGTRSYASPEQLHGSDYDCSTDVYSLGIILFELLYPMYTGMERQICFSQLRDHIFPSDWEAAVGIAFPTVKPLVIDMLSCTPSNRPSAESTVRYIQSILGEFTLVSLDLHHFESPDIFLLRVEAAHRDDVLQHTMQLIREEHSGAPYCVVDIVQYGMRSSRSSDSDKATAIMEFAIRYKGETETINFHDCTADLVLNLSRRPDVLKVRQVSNSASSFT